jgi:hypothetical protein
LIVAVSLNPALDVTGWRGSSSGLTPRNKLRKNVMNLANNCRDTPLLRRISQRIE